MLDVLWLNPPPAEEVVYECASGQILRSTSRHKGRIYVYHNYMCDELTSCGYNILPRNKKALKITSDRGNIDGKSKAALLDHMADMWKSAIGENPESTRELYTATKTLKFEAEIASRFSAQLAEEFIRRHGRNAYPVTVSSAELTKSQLDGSFDFVTVNETLCNIVTTILGKPDDILETQMKATADAVDIDTVLLDTWGKVMTIAMPGVAWKIVGAEERHPFMCVDATGEEEGYIFNGAWFSNHEKLCDEDGCGNFVDCHIANLIAKFARSQPTFPLPSVLKRYDEWRHEASAPVPQNGEGAGEIADGGGADEGDGREDDADVPGQVDSDTPDLEPLPHNRKRAFLEALGKSIDESALVSKKRILDVAEEHMIDDELLPNDWFF